MVGSERIEQRYTIKTITIREVIILISNKINSKARNITKVKEGHFVG